MKWTRRSSRSSLGSELRLVPRRFPPFPGSRLVLLGLLTTIAGAAPAYAQYIYCDTNNDGVNTWADSLTSSPTAVDIWLNTGGNRNGSPGFCGSAGFTSYEFI